MSAKEDLLNKIQRLNDQLKAAEESLDKILIAEYAQKWPLGTKVEHHRKHFVISSYRVHYRSPIAYARRVLKDGSLGAQEFGIYGTMKELPSDRQ